MAGKLRIKVSLKHVEPFWMLVDRKESPLIVNVQKKIEQRLENVNVASLLLDGCLLPGSETSELLRDNDMVHVIVTKYGTSPSPQHKKHRKRKHSDAGDECPGSQNQSELDLLILSASEAKKKRKIREEKVDFDGHDIQKEKEKKSKRKSAAEPCVAGVNKFMANEDGGCDDQKEKEKKKKKKTVAESCTDNELAANNDQKEKEKKEKKKTIAESCMDNELAANDDQKEKEKKKKKTVAGSCMNNELAANDDCGFSTSGHPHPAGVKKTTEIDNKTGLETPVGMEEASERTCLANDTAVTSEKRKRRRRHKKRAHTKDQSEALEEASSKMPAVTKQTPVEMRLPKWQQAQNKKIVFSSESADESASENRVICHEAADKSQDVSQTQPGSSDCNTSSSKCYPVIPSLNAPKGGSAEKATSRDSTGGAVSSDGRRTELDSTPWVSAPGENNLPEDTNGSISGGNMSVEARNFAVEESRNFAVEESRNFAVEENRNFAVEENRNFAVEENGSKGEWYKDKRYHNPVHQYTRNGNEVVQPNLAEYLKMSPAQRGVPIPPFVRAKRLSNGAMLYDRSPAPAVKDRKTALSPFKNPTAPAPAKASHRSSNKQQHLEAVNNNRSIIIENSCAAPNVSVNASGNENKRNGEGSVDAGKSFDDDQETIVLTPAPQDFSIFPDLVTAPKVGDHIAYKMLEMGEDYTPGISDFKEAEVLAYDPRSQNVTVRLFHPNAKKRAPGKFDIDDGNQEEEEVMLELSSMFEPKLISSN